MGCIYIATCKANGKSYIGQTRTRLKTRQKEHLRTAMRKKSSYVSVFQQAIAKYGTQAFEWAVMCEVDPAEYHTLDELEVLAIEINQTLLPNGYNMKTGGGSGVCILPRKRKRSEDTVLPKYIRSCPDGFHVNHHPSGQQTAFTSKALGSEDKLQLAKGWLARVDAGEKIPRTKTEVQRRSKEDEDLPRGIFRLRKPGLQGYYARESICGRRKQAQFGSCLGTMEEKLAKAKTWLENARAGNVSPSNKKLPNMMPKYIARQGEGYRVRKPGYPVRFFGRRIGGDKERLQQAKAYLESCK